MIDQLKGLPGLGTSNMSSLHFIFNCPYSSNDAEEFYNEKSMYAEGPLLFDW